MAAYTATANLVNKNYSRINLGAGTLGGANGGDDNPLTPGVYTFGTGVTISETIYFEGNDKDVFAVQIFGNLVQAANTQVILRGGALARNVFWQVSGNAKMMAGAHMEGILLVKTDVLFATGSSLYGHVYAQTACNLQMATITKPITKPAALPPITCTSGTNYLKAACQGEESTIIDNLDEGLNAEMDLLMMDPAAYYTTADTRDRNHRSLWSCQSSCGGQYWEKWCLTACPGYGRRRLSQADYQAHYTCAELVLAAEQKLQMLSASMPGNSACKVVLENVKCVCDE
jgi:hypothetical protein